MAARYCQVARAELAGGLRPELTGQMSTLQKPQAPFTAFLAAAVQGLTCTLTGSRESRGENLGMDVGRTRGQAHCAAGQTPFEPLIKAVASIDNSLSPARKMAISLETHPVSKD